MPASDPPRVMVVATGLAVPTLGSAKVPEEALLSVTLSVPTTPLRVAPVTVAAVVPSYGLEVTVAPVTLRALAVMLPRRAGWVRV